MKLALVISILMSFSTATFAAEDDSAGTEAGSVDVALCTTGQCYLNQTTSPPASIAPKNAAARVSQLMDGGTPIPSSAPSKALPEDGHD